MWRMGSRSLFVIGGSLLLGGVSLASARFEQWGTFDTVRGVGVAAVSDFNSDDQQDLAVARTSENDVTVLLWDAVSGYRIHGMVNLPCKRPIQDLAAADVNHDGNDDLVVCTMSESTEVWIALGDGSGAFPVLRGSFVRDNGEVNGAVAVGQFNAEVDTYLDVAVTTSDGPSTTGTLSVLLGNGDGTFLPPVEYTTGRQPRRGMCRGVVVGDFDEDSGDDIAVTCAVGSGGDGIVSVFLGDRLGGFGPKVDYGTCARNPVFLAGLPRDINGDGHLDFISTDPGPGDVPGTELSIFLGDGLGGFTRECYDLVTGAGLSKRAWAGVLSEGSDLALSVGPDASYSTPDSVLILARAEEGTFEPDTTFHAGVGMPGFQCVLEAYEGYGPELAICDAGGSCYSVFNVPLPSGLPERGPRAIPLRPILSSSRPNPADGFGTAISYRLDQPARVSLKLYNTEGRLVRTLVDEQRGTGRYTVIWDGRNERGLPVASGSYYYRLIAGGEVLSRSLVLTR